MNEKPTVLIIDDQEDYFKFIQSELGADYNLIHCETWRESISYLNEADLVVLDVNFGQTPLNKRHLLLSRDEQTREVLEEGEPSPGDIEQQGFLILEVIRKDLKYKDLDVIMISDKYRVAGTVHEYYQKYKPATYIYDYSRVTEPKALIAKIQLLCPVIDSEEIERWKEDFGIVIDAENRRMYKLMREAQRIAQTDSNVLILGKTGTGKSLLAEFIHVHSERANNIVGIICHLVEELEQLEQLGVEIFGKEMDFAEKVNLELSRSIPKFKLPIIQPTFDSEPRVNKSLEADEKPKLIEEQYVDAQNKFTETFRNVVEKQAELIHYDLEQIESGIDEVVKKVENAFEQKNTEDAKFNRYIVYTALTEVLRLWDKALNDSVLGKRKLFNFKIFNCASFSPGDDSALLVELFGVPATTLMGGQSQPGVIKAVSYCRGTLFLKEISYLNERTQELLLHVLQKKQLIRFQSLTEEPVNIRIIAATSKDLYGLVKSGRFRHDLYTCLMQHVIELPTLEERKEDFEVLVKYFVAKKNQEIPNTSAYAKPVGNFPKKIELRKFPFEWLQTADYQWPGNVRDLENIVTRAAEMALIEGLDEIQIDHFARALSILEYVKLDEQEEPECEFLPLEEQLARIAYQIARRIHGSEGKNREKIEEYMNKFSGYLLKDIIALSGSVDRMMREYGYTLGIYSKNSSVRKCLEMIGYPLGRK